EHNRLDLLSLAMVTARAAQLLEDGPAAARTAREALGMGRLYERGGMMLEAKSCFARAIEIEDADEELRAEALRAYALVARRLHQYDDAAAAWQRVLGLPVCPRPIEREASQALAVTLRVRSDAGRQADRAHAATPPPHRRTDAAAGRRARRRARLRHAAPRRRPRSRLPVRSRILLRAS